MRIRPAAAVSTALVLVAGAAGTPLLAAEGPERPAGAAAGAATSSVSLLDVQVGSTSARVLELALRSDSLAGAASTSLVVTPLLLDDVPFGRQSLRSRSAVLPAVDSARVAPAAVTALASARSPLVDVSVEGGSSRAATRSLGGVSVLGLPLALDGSLEISSAAGSAGSAGGKTLTVRRLALPSVADLLAARGLDLRTVPSASLTTLLERLHLDTTVTRQTAQALRQALGPLAPQADALLGQIDAAGDSVAAAATEQARLREQLAAATVALNSARTGLASVGGLRRSGQLRGLDAVSVPLVGAPVAVLEPVGVVGAPVLEPVLVPAVEPVLDAVAEPVLAPAVDTALDGALAPVLAPVAEPVTGVTETALPTLVDTPVLTGALDPALSDALAAAQATYDAAVAALADADAAVQQARGMLADTQAALTSLLMPFRSQVDAVIAAATGVLDSTPLVSLDRLEVTTRSAASSAAAGGQTAHVVGGEVQGLRVLGTDVLVRALGSSSVDVLDLVGPAQVAVDTTLADLTGSLANVLSDLPGLGLRVPAPHVALLSRATVTDVVDGFGVAGSALRALTVTWPGLTLPAALAVPGAATLPGVAGLPVSVPAVSGLAARGGARLSSPGDLLTAPLTLGVATLEDRARFRPAVATSGGGGAQAPAAGGATPQTGSPTGGVPAAGAPPAGRPAAGTAEHGVPLTGAPDRDAPPAGAQPPARPRSIPTGLTSLPRTGADAAPSLLALLLVAAALGLHRRTRTV